MFSTARPSLQSQWAAYSNPTVLPPVFHNARYAGWPRSPIQLPHVTSPSSTAQRVDVANNTQPYCVRPAYEPYPRTDFLAQASANIMGPVNPQCRNIPTWNVIQGVVDAHTTTRHDSEDTHRDSTYDYSMPQIMSSNVDVNENLKAYPQPFLSSPFVKLIYDLRFPPTSLRFSSSSPYAGCGYELLFVPFTPERPRRIRLISPDFPWAFDIGPDPSAGEEGVTCLDVLATLHAGLQRPLTDTEWGTAADDRRASLIRARDRRQMIQNAACTVRSVPGANVSNHRLVQQELLLLRVDWLGSRVAFRRLIKDEAFAKSRLIPGGGQPSETWVVKFKKS